MSQLVIFVRWFVIRDGAPGCALEIVILSALERPQKCEQPDQSEPERQRHQNDEYFHHDLSGAARRARSAFSITSNEDPDIAAAAIRGVAKPATAIGTARTLYPTASQRFCRIRCNARREKSIAATTGASGLPRKTRSAAAWLRCAALIGDMET